jgi:DNA-binding protein HU-beta
VPGARDSQAYLLDQYQELPNRKTRGHRVNKSELIDAIAASADLPKAVAGRALDAVIESVTGALKAGESVVLVGFGTFSVKDRAARTGRNPQTGKAINIAAAKIPGFKAGKALKDAVN